MNLIDIMTQNPKTVRSNQSLRAALLLMDEYHIHHLPVLSQNGHHLVGILSDRDCRLAINSPFLNADHWNNADLIRQIQVRNAMTTAPIVIESNTPITKAASLMLNYQIGCLPVMRSETLIGIITRSDILIAFISLERHYQELFMTN